MRRSLPTAALAGVLVLFACDAVAPTSIHDPTGPPDLGLVGTVGAVCGAGTEVPLIADGDVPVGTVRIVNGETSLWVIYRTDPTWPISKTALSVVGSSSAIPTNGPGNPQPGRFAHKSRHRDVHEVIWEVDLGSLTGDVVVAAFAEVGADTEGAWAGGGEGVPIRPGGSWATYVPYAIAPCESIEQEVGTEGATLELQDLTFRVPANSIQQPTTLTIQPTTLGLQNEIKFYEFGPSGTQFDPPAELVIEYDDAALPSGVMESQIRVAIANGIFDLLPEFVADPVNNTMTFPVEHFSAYGLVFVDQADLRVQFPTLSEDPPRVGVATTFGASVSAAPGAPAVTGAVAFFELTGDADLVAVPAGCTDASGLIGPDIVIRCELDLQPGVLVPLEVEVVPTTVGGALDAAFFVVAPLSVEDPNPTNNRAPISTVADPTGSADLRAQFPTLSENPPRAGVPVTYGASYSAAPGSPTVSGATATFELTGDASLLSWPSACLDFSSIAIADVAVVCTLTLEAGQLETLEFEVVANSADALLEAVFEVSPPADWVDPDPSNNQTSLSTRSIGLFADLEMESSAPPVAVVGQAFDWTATATARSDNVDVVDIVVAPQLIAGDATLVLPTGCGANTCFYENVDPEQPHTAVIQVTANAVGDITLRAAAALGALDPASDPDDTNNAVVSTVTAYLEVADVSVALSDAPDPVTVGGTVGYTVSLANAAGSLSQASVGSVLFTVEGSGSPSISPIPAGCTDVSAANPAPVAVECPISSIAPGANANLPFSVVANASGALQAYAEYSVPGTVLDPDGTNNTDVETTTVSAPPPAGVDLSVGFLEEPPLVLGIGSQYTLGVTNPSGTTSVNVTLEFYVEGDVVFGGTPTPGCAVETATTAQLVVLCAITVSANSTFVAPFLITPQAAGQNVVILGGVFDLSEPDPNTGNNEELIERLVGS